MRVGTFEVSARKSIATRVLAGGSPTAVGDRDSVKVAVCTDIVVVARVEAEGRLAFDSLTPRSAVVISAVGDKGIRLKGTREYSLRCVSTEERDEWMKHLCVNSFLLLFLFCMCFLVVSLIIFDESEGLG